jgi:hypothetical protein
MDDCFDSNPSAAMTRPLRHDITTFELSTIAPAPAFSRAMATTALRNDQPFQHNQEKPQEGNER